jgi:hypothetical protein
MRVSLKITQGQIPHPRHFVLHTKNGLFRHCAATGSPSLTAPTKARHFVSAINELRKLGLATVTAHDRKPTNAHFQILFAAFDFPRMPFARTNQHPSHSLRLRACRVPRFYIGNKLRKLAA